MTYPSDDLYPGDDVFPDGLSTGQEAAYSASLVARVPQASGAPTLTEVDRLVFEDLTYVDELNRPGSASLSCPLGTLSAVVKARLVDLGNNPSEVWIFRDSDLVWAGGIDTVAVQDRTVQIECSGLLGYLWRMGLTTDLVFDQLDQFTIAAGLVDHHQSLLFGNYGIDTGHVGTSGVLLSRDWSRDELLGVGDLLTELGEALTGFDFYVEPGTRDLTLAHPRRGRDLTRAVFLDDRNIDSAAVAISVAPEDMITDLSATATWADSVGTNSTVYLARSNTGLRGSFGRVWGSQTFSVPQTDEMEDHADAYLEERDRPLFQPGVTIVPRVGADVGDFTVGDTVQYSYDAGLGLQTGDHRVSKMSVHIEGGGARRISVEFARLESIERVVRNTRRALEALKAQALARLGTHTHNDAVVVVPGPDGSGGTGGTGTSGAQTLGVGGIAAPAPAAGVFFTTADSASTLHITAAGIYDGLGHTVPKILIEADGVTVQNFYVRGGGNAGIYSIGAGNTIQNCDIAQIDEGGEGDINGIVFFGDDTKVLFNAVGKADYLAVRPLLGSHTDGIQTWNTPTKRASSNVLIRGNWISGPGVTDDRYIHQGVMAEGADSTDGGGGGTGTSANWLVEGNYFRTFGNQCLKFDDIHNVAITKNRFDGVCSKIVATGSLSTGISFLSDNTITGTYGATVGD